MLTEVKKPDLSDIARRNSKTEKEVAETIEMIKRAMKPYSKRVLTIEGGISKYCDVERRGLGVLNTRYGKFWEFEFTIDDNWETYSVIVKSEDLDPKSFTPKFRDKDNLILRIDSGCKTGQVFGDLTCDCHEQLDLTLKILADKGEGIIINIPKQDGRGMGISFKLATLWLQDVLGVDTVESALIFAPGEIIDIRTYSGVIGILRFFDIPESCAINLVSNNPKKSKVFKENGYSVGDFVPVVVRPTKYTEKHLVAKQKHLGHIKLVNRQ